MSPRSNTHANPLISLLPLASLVVAVAASLCCDPGPDGEPSGVVEDDAEVSQILPRNGEVCGKIVQIHARPDFLPDVPGASSYRSVMISTEDCEKPHEFVVILYHEADQEYWVQWEEDLYPGCHHKVGSAMQQEGDQWVLVGDDSDWPWVAATLYADGYLVDNVVLPQDLAWEDLQELGDPPELDNRPARLIDGEWRLVDLPLNLKCPE